MQVVADGVLVGRVLVPADVDADNATKSCAFYLAHQCIDATTIETESIVDRAMAGKAKKARFRIAWLRFRRCGVDSDMADAQRSQCIDAVAVLVEARSEADRVGKSMSIACASIVANT